MTKMMFKMSTASLHTSWQTTTPVATDESLLWCHNDVIIGHSIAK